MTRLPIGSLLIAGLVLALVLTTCGARRALGARARAQLRARVAIDEPLRHQGGRRMKLRDLAAQFVGSYSAGPPITYRRQDHVEGAQGLVFQCPLCAQGKPVVEGTEYDGELRRFVRGVHSVLCWFRNPRNAPPVPDDADPKPGRWIFEGDSIDTISFVGPAAASVLLTSGCRWHGFIRNGEATLS